MSKPTNRYRPSDPRAAAEAAFKSVTNKPAAPLTLPTPAAPAAPAVPNSREMVSLRIDREVLAFFQADGPGWQDHIHEVLRKAAGK